MYKAALLGLITLLVLAPLCILVIEEFRDQPDIEETTTLDWWSVVHFGSGVVLFLVLSRIGFSPRANIIVTTVLGCLFEVVEHLLIEPLAMFGGRELVFNIGADMLLVYLGAITAMWIWCRKTECPLDV